MAFSACLPGCSPGNETCEFEQGFTNDFITAIIAALSALSYWEECSHKNNVCLFLGQLWINLSRRVYLTLSLHDFHIMIYIILDKFSRVPIKNVKRSIFAVPV